jgi:transposase
MISPPKRFKWGKDSPFPSYKRIANLMGISVKMARRHAQSLEQKRLLVRQVRRGQPNRFNLEPLFQALEKRLESKGTGADKKPRLRVVS